MTTPPQAPGWYPDPDDPDNRRRYWNGTGWTTHTEPLQKPSWWATNRNGLVAVAVVVGGLFLLAGVNSLRGDDEQPAAEPQVTMPADQLPQADTDAWVDCDPVPQKVLDVIADGANRGTAKLRNGWFVRSDDYTEVYFVAAQMDKPTSGFPVFSLNGFPGDRDRAFEGMVLSVNDDAGDNFVYPYGPDTPAGVSMSDDGAQEAYDCATDPQQ